MDLGYIEFKGGWVVDSQKNFQRKMWFENEK